MERLVIQPVELASGVVNIFGNGYWYHVPLDMLHGIKGSFRLCTPVMKTVTLLPRKGNMMMIPGTTQPLNPYPRCIRIDWKTGSVLNAVGLTNPGLPAVLKAGVWQRYPRPFLISIMLMEDNPSDREAELREIRDLLAEADIGNWASPVGIQMNLRCPNTGHDAAKMVSTVTDAHAIFEGLAPLGVPIDMKMNILDDPKATCEMASHPAVKKLTVTNTIPWGAIPDKIRWDRLFQKHHNYGAKTDPDTGMPISPLAHLGGGGLSSPVVLPLLVEWLVETRLEDFRKPITAGGGIRGGLDVDELYRAGASNVSMGSIVMVGSDRVDEVIGSSAKRFGPITLE